MGEIVNKRELAKILGKSERALTEWQKEGMPIASSGARGQANRYDTQKVIEWLIKRASDQSSKMDAAKLRLTIAQAEKAELEVKEMHGELIAVDDMKMMWSNVLAAFRAKVLSIPSRLTPQLTHLNDPKKIDKIIKETLFEALNELAEYDPEHHGSAKKRYKGRAQNRRSAGAA